MFSSISYFKNRYEFGLNYYPHCHIINNIKALYLEVWVHVLQEVLTKNIQVLPQISNYNPIKEKKDSRTQ
jgi:hypothetical protein